MSGRKPPTHPPAKSPRHSPTHAENAHGTKRQLEAAAAAATATATAAAPAAATAAAADDASGPLKRQRTIPSPAPKSALAAAAAHAADAATAMPTLTLPAASPVSSPTASATGLATPNSTGTATPTTTTSHHVTLPRAGAAGLPAGGHHHHATAVHSMKDHKTGTPPSAASTPSSAASSSAAAAGLGSPKTGPAGADGTTDDHAESDDWTTEDSEQLYHLNGWGAPYFHINPSGHITVDPLGTDADKHSIDMYELVEDVIRRGHNLPLLIRFSDILRDRVRLLNEAFRSAIEEHKYANIYKGVYSTKVCQQRHVVEEIVKTGKKWGYGLEAGSKPELLIALGTMTTPDALIVCNGYKDTEYIETALLAQRLGQTPIIIIEKIHEADLVLQAAKKLNIKPILGVRTKLGLKNNMYQHSMSRRPIVTGEHSKFGLSAAEIMQVVESLRKENMLDSLQLLHFHIGSQVSRISVIKDALREAGRFYVELAKLGANMKYFDVGGGLGIDYDGSKTSFQASMNYTMHEYATDIVHFLQGLCSRANIAVPVIVSESGRAVASHHSVLVFSALGATKPYNGSKWAAYAAKEPEASEHTLIRSLYDVYKNIGVTGLQESIHDATQFKDEASTLFNLGLISLGERSKAEELYWMCCKAILPLSKRMEYVPEELQELDKAMACVYSCNFSVFQSAPDSWAMDQLFPIMPIHRLHERPTELAILADLTCDSDGKIDQFICSGTDDVKALLEVHELEKDSVTGAIRPYYIGMFLNGAYQEVLGNIHNLYGDTNVIHIETDPEDKKNYIVEHVIKGDTNDEVLRFMQWDPKSLAESIRLQSEQALKMKKLTLPQYRLLVKHYEKGLQKYTYLWADED